MDVHMFIFYIRLQKILVERESHVKKPSYRIAIALVQRGERWLVAQRRATAHMGGLWEFPGGKIEQQETPTQAALRELREECVVEALAVAEYSPQFHGYADRDVTLYPVLCVWQSGETESLDNAACRWVTMAELERLEMPPANAAVVAAMKQRLSAQ